MSFALLLALVGACEPEPAEPPPGPPPQTAPRNLILVTLDTLRADHLGYAGYFRDTSPALDTLAGVSLVFTDAQSPMGTTLPTHRSLLTGAWPIEHGLLGNFGNVAPGGSNYGANPAFRSLAEHAKDADYATAAFVSAAPLKRHTGIDSGFQVFDEPAGAERNAGETTARVQAWLAERDPSQPFLLWVHYFDPHYPYAAPEDFPVRYETDDDHVAWLHDRQVLKRFPASIPQPDGTVSRVTLDSATLNNDYDREIRYLDTQVATLLHSLQQAGVWNTSALAVTGDHGEGLGQHREWMHGNHHLEQLAVPLMFHAPGLAPGRVSHPVSVVGTMPTLLELAGSPAWAAPWLSQASVSSLLDAPPEPVFSQRTGDHRPEMKGEAWVIDDGRWRYVQEPDGQDRLIHREQDPHALQDRIADPPPELQALRDALAQTLAAQRARAAAPSASAPAEPLDPALIEQLRTLGYTQ